MCSGEVLGVFFGGDCIKSVGKISLESWGERCFMNFVNSVTSFFSKHTHKMVPEAVDQKNASGSLGVE